MIWTASSASLLHPWQQALLREPTEHSAERSLNIATANPAKLSPASIQWSITHATREGDTDVLPIPFELVVIGNQRDTFVGLLSDVDIATYTWQGYRSLLIPKDQLSFRSVCQLDPLDYVLAAAIVKECGQVIENYRRSAAPGMVFSRHFAPTDGGSFYGGESAWHDFWNQSELQAAKAKYVVRTDISDFYNQISHHALENQLEACGLPIHYRTALMNLLKALTQGVSKGVPVGPHATHLLAELSMAPIDKELHLLGQKFCRYIDDYHLFCSSKDEAQVALLRLAETLNHQQRLHLNRGKTSIMESNAFREKCRSMKLNNPINAEEKDILAMIGKQTDDPYASLSFATLDKNELKALSDDAIEAVVECYLDADEPDFPRLRWFLRRLAQTGAPGGVQCVVRHLQDLVPAMAEASRYLAAAAHNYTGDWKEMGASLMAALQIPIVKKSEYLQAVVLNLFSKIKGMNHVQELVDAFDSSGPIARREIVMAAAEMNAGPWLSRFKDTYSTLDPWMRRAVLYATKAFPSDERKYWLKMARRTASPLEQTIIKSLA